MNDKKAKLDDLVRQQDEDTRKRVLEHAARTQLLLLRARLLRLGVGGATDESPRPRRATGTTRRRAANCTSGS